MLRKNFKGFTLVELMIVITVILVLMTLFLALRNPIMRQLNNLRCRNNLKAFDSALALYRNDFNQKYPDCSGVKFIAILYRTGYLVEKKYFLCPAKESDDWVDSGPNRTDRLFLKPAPGENYSPDWDPKFKPTEISYAGRKNGPDYPTFVLSGTSTDPTPIVSDNTLGPTGDHDKKYAPHGGGGGEVNVLLTNGSIIPLRNITVGVRDPEVEMDLECLLDDNDGK
jgi:prepilin-type N-terminal cleavage/methylation domain-containing protein